MVLRTLAKADYTRKGLQKIYGGVVFIAIGIALPFFFKEGLTNIWFLYFIGLLSFIGAWWDFHRARKF